MKGFRNLGRLVGGVASMGNIALIIVLLFFNPFGNFEIPVETYFIFSLMIVLSLLALYACIKVKPLVMYGAFFGSFFPIGLYLLGVPSIFKWIGIFDVLYLVAAVLMSLNKQSFILLTGDSLGGLPVCGEDVDTGPSSSDPVSVERLASLGVRRPSSWWLAVAGSLMGLAACAYEAYRFSCPHLVHSPWEIPALGAYILFFGAALVGSLRCRRRVVLAAGVLALGLTVLLFVTGLFSAFTTPDYVFFLPGSLLILLAGLLLQSGAGTVSQLRPPRR